jgi:hypothetical protein
MRWSRRESGALRRRGQEGPVLGGFAGGGQIVSFGRSWVTGQWAAIASFALQEHMSAGGPLSPCGVHDSTLL